MKLNIFSKKNMLDERQEQTLLKLESRGFWLLWWGLLAVLSLQVLLGKHTEELVAEWILFMAASLYLLIECLRNGIWDRHIKPNTPANLAGSLIAGIFTFLFVFLRRNYWPGALMAGIFTAVLCFVTLQFVVLLYQKRHDQLERGEEDEDERTDSDQQA